MNTTRRNFLSSIPFLAALFGLKEKPISGNTPIRFYRDLEGDIKSFGPQWANTYVWVGRGNEIINRLNKPWEPKL